VFCNHSASIEETYDQHHDEDGYLYIAYGGENTFGGSYRH